MNKIKNKIEKLKSESGTHSPSIATLIKEIPEIKIKIDACFLSNPYATELFLEYFKEDLLNTNKLRDVLEFYPPQNIDVRKYISKAIGVQQKRIFAGNGAIEIIQAILHRFCQKKIVVILPTFSSYYEFILPNHEVVFYYLEKDDNFNLDILKFIQFVKINNPDTIVIINPNNPNGGYIPKDSLIEILKELKDLENLVIDESFIHFAYEDVALSQISTEELVTNYDNLIIIKSMSKDFGIAGVRAGYAVMSEKKVNTLLSNGYLWNISGLADYFFKVYSSENFIRDYDIVRKKYIMNTLMFLSELSNTSNKIKVYPSKANFALIELLNGEKSIDFAIKLLINNNIYVRDCSDKKGLNGEFIRIASRTFEENLEVIKSIKSIT